MQAMDTHNQNQPLFSIYDLDWDHDDDNDLVTEIQVTREQIAPRLRGGAMTYNIFQNQTSATIQIRCYLDHEALAPYACVSVVTNTDKVYFSDYQGHNQLFQALFGAKDTRRFAYEFAQEHALEWSDLPDFDGCYPVGIEDVRFSTTFTPVKLQNGLYAQHKAVLDPSDDNRTEVFLTEFFDRHPASHMAPTTRTVMPTITVVTSDGEFDSYKNPEKMPQFFGADWREELGYALENL